MDAAYRRYGRLGESLADIDKGLRKTEAALAGAGAGFTAAERGQTLPDDVNRLTPKDVGDFLRAAREGVDRMDRSAGRLSAAHRGTPREAAADASADELRRAARAFPSTAEIGAAQREAEQQAATKAAGAPLTPGRLTAARQGRTAPARRTPAPRPGPANGRAL
ncbi:hypothetical protein [Streptomonospora nanhaiensis]|uniref:Uncharacterized protein n=1 Tax=Streptomonospora nanhaiensis TaxID=1323731 RepID=A0A853BJN0_9ACTN|nr:hypothetical protein [Streptomonospora nanhaiensis]MBV2363102.1 hypothetical protein [Streptomonospora nanhaiensis]NYI95473.1 hypothetical protein [Streptomonospora nanhaiensis]